MLTNEIKLLYIRDPDISSSDEWPAFSLTKAKVVSQQSGELISLLSAHKANPVTVTGRLEEVDEEFASSIRDTNYKKHIVELKNITTYAFAEYEGGGYGFWAAGQAGWFELEASTPEYKPIQDEMEIAASMLYFLADKVRRSRKSKFTSSQFNAHIKRHFKEFLELGKYPTRFADIEDVKDGFQKHREFLISSMLESQEGLDWKETPFFKYFQLLFPDDVNRIRQRILGVLVEQDINMSEKKAQSELPDITDPQAISRRGRPRKDSTSLPPKTPVSKKAASYASSDEEDYGNLNVITRKRKSILQPSGSKYSKKSRKATGRRRSIPVLTALTPSDNDEDEDEEETPSTENSPITTIKNDDHLHLITNPQMEDACSDGSPPPQFMPRKYFELKVVQFDLPSMEPQGPGDLWTCAFDGCFHRIHKARSPTGKTKIREHFKTHKSDAQEKIDLALDESRPYLPVNNLVRRLQAFAPSSKEEKVLEQVGRQFSAPIRRKY